MDMHQEYGEVAHGWAREAEREAREDLQAGAPEVERPTQRELAEMDADLRRAERRRKMAEASVPPPSS